MAALGVAYVATVDPALAATPPGATPPLGAATPGVEPAGSLTALLSGVQLLAGEPLSAQGRLASGQARVPVALEYRPARGAWSVLATALSGAGGSYRVRAPLTHSGIVRVALGGLPALGAGALRAVTPSATGTSLEQAVTVGARLLAGHVSLDVLPSQRATVSGVLRPAKPGRVVELQLRGRGAWTTATTARIDASGRYTLRYSPHGGPGSQPARLRFGGDTENGPARRQLGYLNVFRTAAASWYGGGGSLACGGSLSDSTLGVAHKTLPCGTRITLRYHGRTVSVPVIDRGPYVSGRELDLTAATKRALGFGDIGMVWTTR